MKKKKIQNKNYIQKIIMMLLIVVSMSMVCPSISLAADSDDKGLTERVGGVLLKPISDLLVGLGDAIVQVTHNLVVFDTAKDQNEDKLEVDTLMEVDLRADVWDVVVGIVLGILAVIAIIGLSIVSGGLAGVAAGTGFAAGAIGAVSAGTILCGTIGGMIVGGVAYTSASLDNHYFLPTYAISPEEIFQNKLPLFNINFFEPEKNSNTYESMYEKDVTGIDIMHLSISGITINEEDNYTQYAFTYNNKEYEVNVMKESSPAIYVWEKTSNSDTKTNIKIYSPRQNIQDSYWDRDHSAEKEEYYSFSSIEDTNRQLKKVLNNYGVYTDYNSFIANNNHEYSDGGRMVTVTTPEGIKLTIKNKGEENEKITLYDVKEYTNIASDLQKTVSKWYVTLRNIALVASMSILVYVGIRMMLTSIASEKAKYKNMLFDWLVGVALLFVMQYIMIFSNNFVEEVTKLFDTQSLTFFGLVEVESGKKDEVEKALGNTFFLQEKNGTLKTNENGNYYLSWPTNLMGVARLNAQMHRDTKLSYIGYTLVFLILVFYTVFFVFTYLKRVLYMAFLTIIAPFVAMTYPLDKLSDGKAQAFNMWIKEYIFNLMIQPFHLLLYVVLVSSAIELATESILYSLVALGFLMPAEKLLRKFFGFDKAQTPGFLGGAAGAALTMSFVGGLNKFAKGGKPQGGGGKPNQDGKINYSRQKVPGNSFKGDLLSGNSEERKNPQPPAQTAQGGKQTGTYDADPEKYDYPPPVFSEGNQATSQNESTADPEKYDYPSPVFSEDNEAASQNESIIDHEHENINEYMDSQGTREELEDAFGIDKDYSTEYDEEYKARQLEEWNEENEYAIFEAEEQEKRSRRRAIARAMGYNARESIRKSAANAISNAPSKLLRGGARFVGAGVLGGVGLAAGITSGDPNNLIKMGGAGLAAGNALGAGIANRVGVNSVGKYDEVRADNIYKEALGTAEYTKMMNERLDKEFLKDPTSRNLYKGKFTDLNDNEISSVMKRSIRYKDKGLTDDKTIIELMKIERNRRGKDYITNLDNDIDKYTEALGGLVKDVSSPKDIDRIEKALKDDTRYSDAQTNEIIKDLYGIKGFKRT